MAPARGGRNRTRRRQRPRRRTVSAFPLPLETDGATGESTRPPPYLRSLGLVCALVGFFNKSRCSSSLDAGLPVTALNSLLKWTRQLELRKAARILFNVVLLFYSKPCPRGKASQNRESGIPLSCTSDNENKLSTRRRAQEAAADQALNCEQISHSGESGRVRSPSGAFPLRMQMTLSHRDPLHVVGGLGCSVTRHAQYTDHRERHTSGGADFITVLGHERQCHLQKDRPAGGAGFRDQIVRPCDTLLESSSAAIHRTDTLFLWGPGPPQNAALQNDELCYSQETVCTQKRV